MTLKIDKNEEFPVSVALFDECAGGLATGLTVYYDIRYADTDASLSPPIYGTMVESTVEPGVYKIVESIPSDGEFIFYATCSGYMPNTEEIIVNPESIYDLEKQNRSYNISVEDVIRTNATPTASQIVRNVPLSRTDYIINWIKPDYALDWTDPATTSGIIFAWYRTTTDKVPYRMGAPY
jgi:hypothetical protein